MKIRTAFVSNSSSSSFVAFTTLDNHRNALARLSPDDRLFIEGLRFERMEKFGQTFIQLEANKCEDMYYIQGEDMLHLFGGWDGIEDGVPAWEKYLGFLDEMLSHYTDG